MQLEAGSKTLRAHGKVNCCGLSLLLFYVLEGRAMVSFRPSQEKKSVQVSGELEVFRPSRDTPILLISVLYVLPPIRLHPYYIWLLLRSFLQLVLCVHSNIF